MCMSSCAGDEDQQVHTEPGVLAQEAPQGPARPSARCQGLKELITHTGDGLIAPAVQPSPPHIYAFYSCHPLLGIIATATSFLSSFPAP